MNPEMTEMGRSHGKGTSFFLELPPREWWQNLVKHACLSTGQRALPCNHRLLYSVHIFSKCFLMPVHRFHCIGYISNVFCQIAQLLTVLVKNVIEMYFSIGKKTNQLNIYKINR
jgi:hypothetical protein